MEGILEHTLGRIYIIENNINDKAYIGQTVYTLAEHFYGHKYLADKHTNTKLYIAMNELGIDNFTIEGELNLNQLLNQY